MLWNFDYNTPPWQSSTRKLWLWVGLLMGAAWAPFSGLLAAIATIFALYMGSSRGTFLLAPLNRERFVWRNILIMLGYFLLIQFGAITLAGLTKVIFELCQISYMEQQTLVTILQQASPLKKSILIVAIVITVPIAEELLFRRVLYAILHQYIGVWGAVIVTSLIFGGVHLFGLGFASLTFMAIIFQLIYIKYGNIFYPILLHSWVNTWAVVLALFVELP